MSLVIFAFRASCNTKCLGLKVSMKTTKTGVQRIKMNSHVMYERNMSKLTITFKIFIII